MTEQVPDDDDLWVGQCPGCRQNYQILDAVLMDVYPELMLQIDEVDEFEADCPTCKVRVILVRQSVKIVPFSAWTVLPAATGCPMCGSDHDPNMPHNRDSLVYQYAFRSQEAQAGREERWPTWADAMAHCPPTMRASWIEALRERGVEV